MSVLRLKCTTFDFRTRWGSLQRSLSPLAVFKGSTSKGREEKRGREEKGKGKGRGE